MNARLGLLVICTCLVPGAVGQPAQTSGRFANLSLRSLVTAAGDPVIAGFVISGSEAKTVLIRAIGPGLGALGVADALENPRITVHRSSGEVVAANDDWDAGQDSGAVAAVTARIGAFPLALGSKDSAVSASLTPGAYTVHASSAGERDGVALVEVYDATDGVTDSSPRIINISARSFGGTGDRTLIAGFVVGGNSTQQVLIRGIGPALTALGVDGVLTNPVVEVYRGGTRIGFNDDWAGGGITPVIPPETISSPTQTGGVIVIPITSIVPGVVTSDTRLAQAAAQVGAFALTPGGRDAALILDLAPGPYTAQVKLGPDSAAGAAMIEAYELRPAIPALTPPPPTIIVPQVTPGAGL